MTDQFSKYTRLYPMQNQQLDTIMEILETEYFRTVGLPEEILTDNAGQFLTNRWKDFAREHEFNIRKTSPYNPQSNPVERVMREIGRVIRTYASYDRQTWNKIIFRLEQIINATVHSSTDYAPDNLHFNGELNIELDPTLIPYTEQRETRAS